MYDMVSDEHVRRRPLALIFWTSYWNSNNHINLSTFSTHVERIDSLRQYRRTTTTCIFLGGRVTDLAT